MAQNYEKSPIYRPLVGKALLICVNNPLQPRPSAAGDRGCQAFFSSLTSCHRPIGNGGYSVLLAKHVVGLVTLGGVQPGATVAAESL